MVEALTAEEQEVETRETELPQSEKLAQTMLLVVLFAVPTLHCAYAACVNDPDIWWHLRSGEWMMLHRAVPRSDPFSTYGAGRPWVSYSWLFELLVAGLFQKMGLAGIVAYTSGMVCMFTVALHHLIKRLQADFNIGVLLTLVASLGMECLYTPRPWHFTILFFILVIDIVLHARNTGKVAEVMWLPCIFALWANVHIQFVDGLIVVALAAAEAVAGRWWTAARTRLQTGWIVGALVASAAATLINPYGWRIYKTAYELASQPGVMDHISELQSIPFRFVGDYCVLLLALGAAAVLARSGKIKVFETVLLIFAAVVSFRSRRDVWLMATVGSAIVAAGVGKVVVGERRRMAVWSGPVIALATSLIVCVGFRWMRVNNARLSADLVAAMPVRAVEFVKNRGYTGPLYNDYGWGGYLMWGLRKPVSIDGRAGLHGSERIGRYGATWAAEPDWQSDPELRQAGIVIGPVRAPLMQVLRMDARYQVAFEDKVAVVFVPRKDTAVVAALKQQLAPR